DGREVHRAQAAGRRSRRGGAPRARDVRAAARERGDRGLPLRSRGTSGCGRASRCGRRWKERALMRWGVVVFPGSLDDRDALRAAGRILGDEAVPLWHKERDLRGVDCVVLPGGFSYGDYLRCGAMARCSPVMEAVAQHAAAGGLVLGVCNGFQILCEAGLLPGALVRNRLLTFVCDTVTVKVETTDTPFTVGCRQGQL